MTDSGRRLLVGVCFLAALWILVYWLWQPSRPAIRFDRASPDAPEGETAPTARGLDRAPHTPGMADGRAPVQTPETQPQRRPPQGPAIRDPLGEVDIEADHVPPPIAPPAFRNYTIQAGDTFERIAERELGSRARASEIIDANPGKDPRRLRIGDVIRLPTHAASGNPSPAAPPATPPPSAPGAGPVPSTYTVRRGDTLSVISQTLYGTSRHADLIFSANRDQLRSPDDIREGQVLKIPPRPQ